MFYYQGKIGIFSRSYKYVKFDRELPLWSTALNIIDKLYATWSPHPDQTPLECIFCTFDHCGKSTCLIPMAYPRIGVSLSGLPTRQVAIGGFHGRRLKTSEMYMVAQNKWVVLPPLNTAVHFPGSALLESLRAFRFGGFEEECQLFSHMIESLETEKDGKWKDIPLGGRIDRATNLAAAAYLEKIIVFGGSVQTRKRSLLILSEEGKLEKDGS